MEEVASSSAIDAGKIKKISDAYEIAVADYRDKSEKMTKSIKQAKELAAEMTRDSMLPEVEQSQQKAEKLYGQLDALTAGYEKIQLNDGYVFERRPHDPAKVRSYDFQKDVTASMIENKKNDKSLKDYEYLRPYLETKTKQELSVKYKDNFLTGKWVTVNGVTTDTETGEVLKGITAQLKPDELQVKKV